MAKKKKKGLSRKRPHKRPRATGPKRHSRTFAAGKTTKFLPLPEPRTKAPEISLLRRMEVQFEKNLHRPKVSVVIVNHDGVDSLWHCLFALKTQSYPAYEIILVDNASQDASVSFVKSNYPQVKVMECQENFGYAMGSNLGAKFATGDMVALLGNDAVATPDWLARLVKDFRANWPKAGAIASTLRSKREPEGLQKSDLQALNFLGRPVEGFFEDPQTIFHPLGYAFLYARFLAVEGPFDSDYFSLEDDVYFGWKIRLLGGQVCRSLTAKVFHGDENTPAPFSEWKSAYYRTRNRWLNLFVFYGKGSLLKASPWIAADMVWGQLQSLLAGLDAFLGHGLALAWVLTHPGTILDKRRAMQEKRKVADRDILRFFSGRVARDRGPLARSLNFLSLAYCGVVGLEIMELQGEREQS